MSPDPKGDPSLELERGRAAFDRREWAAAYEALAGADRAAPLAVEDLHLLAVSAYLTGRNQVFEDALERMHTLQRESEDSSGAARSAIWLGLHLSDRGEMARATGWFGRASRILDFDGGDCVERGWLLLPTGLRHLAAGENQAAAAVAVEAADCAQAYGDRDLLALAVHMQGRALLRQGVVAEGLALLDEAMVAVATGELSPQVTGLVYCSVISACRRVLALDRAREWTEALTDWCEAQPDMVAFRGQCRVFRSELMRLQGAWREALDEARRVGDDEAASGAVAGAAFYAQGEVQRLRGELGAAEELFRKASHAGREPQPGLALLRLGQGDVDGAEAGIRGALEAENDALRRARLLPARVEILLEAGEVDGAEAACRELEETAGSYGTKALDTMAAQARGAVALARGEPAAAVGPLRSAWRGWQGLDAPHDAARARALLARACLALGDEDAAAMEADAARATFRRLGAGPDIARLDGVEGRGRPGETHGLTPREREVLALVATGKTNRAIAGDLFISEKTVARHVSNILGKLGLSSRSAATAYAYEHGLTGPPA